MKDITFSVIEIFVSLIIETVIMGGLFTWISNKTSKQNEQQLKDELSTIESQNKLIYQELKAAIIQSKTEIISQVKESASKGG
jgi:NADH:ubiquinone oxidoreductase subunit F (NADH-binding)